MEDIEVPPFFLCPISLQVMKDPVTVSTGITYDRESIEKWLFSGKNNTCPVTKQVLSGTDLIPNVTLRRLIQAWCAVNASQGIERFPTPRPPISKSQLLKLLNEANSPQMQMKSLQRLRSIASHNETNKRSMETAGAAEFLASIVNDKVNEMANESERAGEEALSLLYSIQLSESGIKSLLSKNGEFIESLVHVMQKWSYDSRAYAVMLLKSIADVADQMKLVTFKQDLFIELVEILRDQICRQASKATLKLLINICPHGRNRIKAVEAGAVPVLVDLLVDSSEKRETELMIMLLELLCQCAEGRSELLKHGAGLAMVSKKILRVSPIANERAVKILYSLSRFSASPMFLQEMLSLGVVSKLCLVLQVECGSKMKERAREILKQNAWAWKNSPCVPMNLLCSYPC